MEQTQYNSLFSFIWNIANDVLVYAFERSDYKRVILPMMVLRRIDVLLEPTKQEVLAKKQQLDAIPERIMNDNAFVNAARNSNKATAQQQFNRSMWKIVTAMLNVNSEFCKNYLDNLSFMNFINNNVFNNVYSQVK